MEQRAKLKKKISGKFLPSNFATKFLLASDHILGNLDTFLGNHRTALVAEKARKSLAEEFETIMDVNAIMDGAGDFEISAKLQAGVATNLKRYSNHAATNWFSAKVEDPYWILDTVEFKTAWHPIGI